MCVEMRKLNMNRTAPRTWIVSTIAGGILFVVGGIATTIATTPRLVMTAGAVAFVVLGLYTAVGSGRNELLRTRCAAMEESLDAMRGADTSLRTHMAYTLRDPLVSIISFADRMADAPDLSFDIRREMLLAIRSDAREVEMSLSELATADPCQCGVPGKKGCQRSRSP